MDSCRVEFFFSSPPGIQQLALILPAPIGPEEKMQIINSEVRSNSPHTPPAGLTEVSQKESSLGVSHWVSLLISDTYSLRKAFRNVQLQEGLIIRDEVFSCILSKFVN